MPTVREVLDAAAEAHVEVVAEGGRIKCTTESGPLPDALREMILQCRSALLQALQVDRGVGAASGARRGRITSVPMTQEHAVVAAPMLDGITAVEAGRRGRRGGRERVVATIPVELDEQGRRLGLTSTDIAKVAGVSPYGGALDVYLDKTGHGEGGIGAKPGFQQWGLLLEPAVAAHYAREHGVVLIGNGRTTYQHVDLAWALATPDRLVELAEGPYKYDVVEIKCADASQAHLWGPSGSGPDGVPLHYVYQVQWQMEVLQARQATIALLIGGNDYREYVIPRDEDMMGNLVAIGSQFWHEHVLAGKEPPEEAGENAELRLRARYPRNTEAKSVQASADAERWAVELHSVNTEMRLLKQTKDGLMMSLKAEIAENSGLRGNGWHVRWAQSVATKRVTDWASVAAAIAHRHAPGGIMPQDLIEAHTAERTPPRRFSFTYRGEDDE